MDLYLPYLLEYAAVFAVGWLAFSNPRFHYRQIGFVYKRRDGLVALGLWVVMMALSLAASQGALPAGFLSSLGAGTWEPEAIAALLGLVAMLALLFIRRQPPKSAGWGKATQRNGLMLGLALAFLVVFLSGRFTSLLEGARAQSTILLVVAGISLAEETVFRGYIQLRLDWWLGKRYGWLLTAALFVIWRLPLMLMRPETLPLSLALGVIQALLLGWLMRTSGHVLAPALYRFISLVIYG